MRLPRGLTKTSQGWRVTVEAHGRRFSKRYPPHLTLEQASAKLLDARTKWTAGRLTDSGTFSADVARYLSAYMGTSPARAERERHLKLWTAAFDATSGRADVTREDVSRVLQAWRSAGLSPETCNKRRTALLAFYNALDGKGGSNPVRDVPKFRVSPPLPRAVAYPLIVEALQQLPLCKTRARLKVMAYTGARPVQVRQITADDWDRKAKTLLLKSTAKGQGTRPYRIPLTAEGQKAMQEFEATDAYGSFTSAPMARMWKAAAEKAKLPDWAVPYDLRHSFGTQVYRATGDIRATKELLGHASIKMTERYTLAAIPERQAVAVAAFNRAVRKRR